MGRFSSVQSFADDHHNSARKVPYEKVSALAAAAISSAGAGSSTTAAASSTGVGYIPPEKVINPYGSTAGAGSGEFHTYRHSRNRELQRLKHMDQMTQEQIVEQQYQQKLQQNIEWEQERTKKRQQKRQRQKQAKQRKLNILKSGITTTTRTNPNEDDDNDDDINSRLNNNDDDDDNEFQYTPGNLLEKELLSTSSVNDEKNEINNVPATTSNNNDHDHDVITESTNGIDTKTKTAMYS